MDKIKNMNKNKHVIISETNYYKLKNLGRMGDTFDKVLGDLLLQKERNNNDDDEENKIIGSI